MNTNEIRTSVKMTNVLSRYGIKVGRGNMCSCPFHGKDRHPSMKVYADGVHCFSCGIHLDQIGFVQEYEQCDFKTAFIALGGTYENMSDDRKKVLDVVRSAKKAERERKEKAERDLLESLTLALNLCDLKDEFSPDSDEYKALVDAEQFLEWSYEEKYIKGKEINEIDVYRKCQSIRQRCLAIK